MWNHENITISRVLDSTVALGFPPDIRVETNEEPVQQQAFIPRCSGVFISRTEIITAGHCVRRMRLQKIITIGPFSIMPRLMALDTEENPIGDDVYITTYRDYRQHRRVEHKGIVQAFSSTQDLAVLRVKYSLQHSWVPLRTSEPAVGSDVYHVGHPAGEWFTTTTGIVSRQTYMFDGRRILHTTAPGYQGSSGGGVYDREGRLLSIQTEMIQRQSFLVLGTHASDLGEFLALSRGTH